MASTQVHLERALHQIIDKPQLPEIDFTVHQLDNGVVVSTQERVVKDVSSQLSLGGGR